MRSRRTLVICLILLCPFSARALVNINTASLDELDTLPGVGPATAVKIVNARPFSTTDDIQNVQGIGGPGSKTYEDIIGLITVSGATTVVVEDNEDKSGTVNPKSSGSSLDKNEVEHQPVSSLSLKVPSVAYAGQVIDFDIEPSGGTDGRLVRYWWNFGDGNTSDQKTPNHQYQRPGTYVVIVESYFQKETKMARRELEILPLALNLNVLPGGGVEVVNEGDYEIDLSDMTLSGRGNFVFPRHTVLLAGKRLTVESVSGPAVALKDEFSRPLAFNTVMEAPRVSAGVARRAEAQLQARPSAPESAETASTTTLIGPEEEATANTPANNNIAAAAGATVPSGAWPYLGLLALMSFGFIALFGVNRT